MFALIGVWQMDRSKSAMQNKELRERIVPMVSHQPGFVSGYWSEDTASSKSHSFVVFDTLEHAQGLEAFVRQNGGSKEAGVAMESLQVVQIIANTRS
ncbi:MAG: hypothetical protein QM723_01185 [Myxococcaceae bacterium]